MNSLAFVFVSPTPYVTRPWALERPTTQKCPQAHTKREPRKTLVFWPKLGQEERLSRAETLSPHLPHFRQTHGRSHSPQCPPHQELCAETTSGVLSSHLQGLGGALPQHRGEAYLTAQPCSNKVASPPLIRHCSCRHCGQSPALVATRQPLSTAPPCAATVKGEEPGFHPPSIIKSSLPLPSLFQRLWVEHSIPSLPCNNKAATPRYPN